MLLKAYQMNLFFGNNNINTLSDNIFNNHSKYHIQQLSKQKSKKNKNEIYKVINGRISQPTTHLIFCTFKIRVYPKNLKNFRITQTTKPDNPLHDMDSYNPINN